VAISECELFTHSHIFTLSFNTFITDNIINYVVKLLKDKLGLTDAPVALISFFFITGIYCERHKDPTLENKYSYKEVASWTQKMFQKKSIHKMKTIVFSGI
jgi:hypothetical protein